MEMVLIVVLVVVALGGLGLLAFVVPRRRVGTTPEPPPVAAEEAAEEAAVAVAVEPPAAPPSFRERLAKARGSLGGYLSAIRSRKVDQETWDDLEEALIRADVGVAATQRLLEDLRKTADQDGINDPDELLDRLKEGLKGLLATGDRSLRYEPGSPNVWLFVGVNGVGKTTSIGKVARQQMDAGRSIVLAAGDTFRAAASEQLGGWADRIGADVVHGSEGADPSAVIFDAVQRAAARDTDLVLADTAGRLHTKTNLMEELRKVRRVADRDPGSVTEVLLVLDATTGQNGLAQARQFTEAVDVTGLVLTKLDGSAKGGIALAVQSDLGIPIKLVGLGEAVGDLVEFDPDEFVEALFA
jgi:fused signal recognition particle receptor